MNYSTHFKSIIYGDINECLLNIYLNKHTILPFPYFYPTLWCSPIGVALIITSALWCGHNLSLGLAIIVNDMMNCMLIEEGSKIWQLSLMFCLYLCFGHVCIMVNTSIEYSAVRSVIFRYYRCKSDLFIINCQSSLWHFKSGIIWLFFQLPWI